MAARNRYCSLLLLYGAGTTGGSHDVRESPTSRLARSADVTSSSPTADNDADSVNAVNEMTLNSHCGECDCTSDTRSHSPTSITSSNSAGDRGTVYRQPLQHMLLSRQQRKKRSRAAFSHAQAIQLLQHFFLSSVCFYFCSVFGQLPVYFMPCCPIVITNQHNDDALLICYSKLYIILD